MLAVRLDPAMEDKLTKLAADTGRSKTHYVKQAIQAFLDDHEDYLLGWAALARTQSRTSLAMVRKELGLQR